MILSDDDGGTSAVSPADPYSRWSGEGNGDDSLDGNHGTVLDGVTYVPGRTGQAFHFDGTSGRVDMGNPASLNFGTSDPFSLEAWFNWDGAGWYVNNIIRKTDYSGGTGSGYWLRITQTCGQVPACTPKPRSVFRTGWTSCCMRLEWLNQKLLR